MMRAVRRTGLARIPAMFRLGTIFGLRAIFGFSALAWPGDLARASPWLRTQQPAPCPYPSVTIETMARGWPGPTRGTLPSRQPPVFHSTRARRFRQSTWPRRYVSAEAPDLDIATARQRVCESVAELQRARALWLPSLFIGPTWYRADGQIQTITGPVETIDRSSLFIGATAALANAFPSASPGTGFPSLNGLSATLRISDAIYEPLAAPSSRGREPGWGPGHDQ